MHECPSIGARCSVALSMTSHPTPSKRHNPCKYILSPETRPTPTTSNVYADICRYLISTYRILLESYKDKLSNKLHFIMMILDSLKVISGKPQVNQVVPYNPFLLDEVTPSKTRQKLDKVAKPVQLPWQCKRRPIPNTKHTKSRQLL